MRKILYVWNYLEWGGAQIYFMSLMKEAKRSCCVSALLPSNSEPQLLSYLDSLNIPVEFIGLASATKKPNGLMGKLLNRIAIVRSENQMVMNILRRSGLSDTIVHADLGFWHSALSLYRLCRKTNVFVTLHTALPQSAGLRGMIWRLKGKLLTRQPNFHLTASNEDVKISLKPYIDSKIFQQLPVAYSGFDADEIASVLKDRPGRAEMCRRYEIDETRPILISIGQFTERKGSRTVLEALSLIKNSGHDFSFIWLSTSTPDDKTLREVGGYGLGSLFRLMAADEIGNTRKHLLSLLSIADVFVLASHREGLPIALIEAMALGLPCVTTNVNAIPEAIDDQNNGILVPPDSGELLANAILTLLNDTGKRKLLGEAARKTAFSKFNERGAAKLMVDLYERVWKTPLLTWQE